MKDRKTVAGRIILIQEERIRLKDRAGRSFLFDVSHSVRLNTEEFAAWMREGRTVLVAYTGEPETETGVADSIRLAA